MGEGGEATPARHAQRRERLLDAIRAERARQERRPLKDQAAWLLERHLLNVPEPIAESGRPAQQQEPGHALAAR